MIVQPGLNSLTNALKQAQKQGITEIFLKNGEHDEKGEQVVIDFPVSIDGESREHCRVMGGLRIYGNQKDNVNVCNLTLHESRGSGVFGGYKGASFHLDNVSVENSGSYGVLVIGTRRSTMKNCNVSHSNWSGLFVQGGGLMTIDGNRTTLQHNCKDERSHHRGLDTADSTSSIHLVSPLTVAMISKYNGGGGNKGGRGTIKTVIDEQIKQASKHFMQKVKTKRQSVHTPRQNSISPRQNSICF